MPNLELTLRDITALVLAGGRGSRMGGVDKGLQAFHDQPMAWHALRRLAQQLGGPLGQVLINANRNALNYQTLGDALLGPGTTQVLPDAVQDYSGPLAGFSVGLGHCRTPLLLTVPCDSPLFPLDLAQRLLTALQAQQADIAVVHAPEADKAGPLRLRSQPVFCLLKASLRADLLTYLAEGGRKIDDWTARHAVAAVPFDTAGDSPQAFANANTLEDLQWLQAR
jgi:molybdopterin-guanine dinucleotide biosynthesis protein A